jgi:soluble lytic murein transglycosylase-like protein
MPTFRAPLCLETPPWQRPLSIREIADLARSVGFPVDVAEVMASIAWRESRGYPAAVNRSEKTRDASFGLWQLNLHGKLAGRLERFGLRHPDDLLDPFTNARAALVLYREVGLKPWATQ